MPLKGQVNFFNFVCTAGSVHGTDHSWFIFFFINNRFETEKSIHIPVLSSTYLELMIF